MVDRIAHAGVLGDALVGKVYLAIGIDGDVLKQGVAADGVVDVGFAVFVEINDFCVAAAFEIEDTVVVPTVLVIADEQTLRVGAEGGLAGTAKAEEDSCVFALHIGVGRAVHRRDTLQRQVVVHHTEHTLLHLATVPSVENDLLTATDVESDTGLTVKTQLLIVVDFGFAGGVDCETGFEILEFLGCGLDEHIGHEMSLPCDFHDETHSDPGILVGTAKCVDDKELLAAEFFLGKVFHLGPDGFAHRMVVVFVLVRSPPNGVFRVFVHDDIFILGRTSGVDAGHDVNGIKFSELTFIVAGERRIHLHFEQFLIRGIVVNFFYTGYAVLFEGFDYFFVHD